MARKRLLLAGAGRWGKVFLRNLEHHPRAMVAGVVTRQDTVPQLAPGTPLFRDFQKALAAPWDGVILATPPVVHATELAHCFKRGLPTLVEKPLALDLSTAEGLSAQAHSPVLVDHLLIFHPGYEWLKANINPSSIRRIDSTGAGPGPYRPDYSPLWDYGAHDFSLTLDLLGQEPSRINCKAERVADREGGFAGSYHVRMEFAEGVEAEFHVSNTSQHKVRDFVVETSHERFLLRDFPGTSLTRERNGQSSVIELPARKPVERLLDVFCDGLDGIFNEHWGLELGLKVVRSLSRCR